MSDRPLVVRLVGKGSSFAGRSPTGNAEQTYTTVGNCRIPWILTVSKILYL